jgi:lysozyme
MPKYPDLTEQLSGHEGLEFEAYPDPLSPLYAACKEAGVSPYRGGYKAVPGWQRIDASPWTIGRGHNLEAHPDPAYPAAPGTTCTLEQADAWLESDIAEAEASMLHRWPWMSALPRSVYLALLNMVFNMGAARFSGFQETLYHLKRHEYALAADELVDSLWFRQVGSRARRIVAQVRKGE